MFVIVIDFNFKDLSADNANILEKIDSPPAFSKFVTDSKNTFKFLFRLSRHVEILLGCLNEKNGNVYSILHKFIFNQAKKVF